MPSPQFLGSCNVLRRKGICLLESSALRLKTNIKQIFLNEEKHIPATIGTTAGELSVLLPLSSQPRPGDPDRHLLPWNQSVLDLRPFDCSGKSLSFKNWLFYCQVTHPGFSFSFLLDLEPMKTRLCHTFLGISNIGSLYSTLSKCLLVVNILLEYTKEPQNTGN